MRFCFRKWNTIALEQRFVIAENLKMIIIKQRKERNVKGQRRNKFWRFVAKKTDVL